MFKTGDRIKLLSMPNDPAPVEVGARGTVTRCTSFMRGREACCNGCAQALYERIIWDGGLRT